ncbi:MAG: hypothetical protein ACFFDF_00365 [Candidatus Odinarchaeota archaeon]
MPTVQQIIDYVNRKYPNQETDANKIIDLDNLHKHLFVEIAKLKNDLIPYNWDSIAGQLYYSLPDDCTIDNIITLKVSQDTTVTEDTEWNTYEYAGINDDTTTGYWYGKGVSGTIALLDYDEPIDTSGYTISMFYYERPNALDAVTDTPELNADYHDLLKFGLIQELAAQGNNPDTEIANYWQAKYDEFMKEVKDSLSDRYNKAPNQSHQVQEWW